MGRPRGAAPHSVNSGPPHISETIGARSLRFYAHLHYGAPVPMQCIAVAECRKNFAVISCVQPIGGGPVDISDIRGDATADSCRRICHGIAAGLSLAEPQSILLNHSNYISDKRYECRAYCQNVAT